MSKRLVTWVVSVALLTLGLWAHLVAAQAPATSERPVVFVVPIEGVIDLGLAPFVARALKEAEEAGAAAVILEIDTFGGRVDAAVQIRDTLLDSKLRTVAFINKRAISAGALIALASETVVMSAGSTIGAAAPVQVGAPGSAAQPVQEKTVSYVRKEFAATAETRNRPQALAEAMVDADVEVKDVIEKGKLLTLTTEEALKLKVADFRADSIEAVLEQLGLAGAELRPSAPHWAEELVRFLTHPVVSSLLISAGMVGILVELRTPGFGFAGGLGIGSLALFFYGHWLVQLAGWEEVLLAAGGLLLLALEVFLLPGFGIAGALGIVALLGALAMSMTGPGDTAAVIVETVTRIFVALSVGLVASLVLMRYVPTLPFARRLILQTNLGAGPAYGSAPETDLRWLGKQGLAATPLHPSGIAEIEGERVDVVADGVLIDAGEHIEVMRVDGNRIVVRRARTPTQGEQT